MIVWKPAAFWLENPTEVGRWIGLHVAGSSWFHAAMAEGGHGFRWLQDRTTFWEEVHIQKRRSI